MTERLTDAELDALKSTAIGRMCLRRFREYEAKLQQHGLHDCATENEHELRELRAKVSLFEGREQFSLDDFFAQADEIRELTEQNEKLRAAAVELQVNDADAHTVAVEQQNAALVAVLEAIEGAISLTRASLFNQSLSNIARAALASVRGDA